jgi:hypothetical protein
VAGRADREVAVGSTAAEDLVHLDTVDGFPFEQEPGEAVQRTTVVGERGGGALLGLT